MDYGVERLREAEDSYVPPSYAYELDARKKKIFEDMGTGRFPLWIIGNRSFGVKDFEIDMPQTDGGIFVYSHMNDPQVHVWQNMGGSLIHQPMSRRNARKIAEDVANAAVLKDSRSCIINPLFKVPIFFHPYQSGRLSRALVDASMNHGPLEEFLRYISPITS